MNSSRRWFDRMDDKRVETRLTVHVLARRLGITRASYYEYRNSPTAYPHNPEVVARIAEFLDADAGTLMAEMRPGSPVRPLGFLEVGGRSEFAVSLYQEHVRALGHVLGIGGDQELERRSPPGTELAAPSPPRRSGVDVVARLLRERLPRPDEPMDVCVVVRPTPRGLRDRYGSSAFRSAAWEPYQYQIYVIPERLAGTDIPPGVDVEELLERLARKVDDVLAGTLLPATREHSTELALAAFAGRADVLVYPGLLDMRPPGPFDERTNPVGHVLVTGVYYAGAPDVAALLARASDCGFTTFDQLARLQGRVGLRGLPSPTLSIATCRTAVAALQSGVSGGSMVWATDDPETLLTEEVSAAVDGFPGRIVLLLLSDEALAYAAYRLCCVDSSVPLAVDQDRWGERLRRQQRELERLVGSRAVIYQVELPAAARQRADGTYPDVVDAMFDQYIDAAARIRSELTDE